jgi:cation transport protein ChaC
MSEMTAASKQKAMTATMSEDELVESRRIVPEPGADFYVFAYGSLMWRPDFIYADVWPATLFGYHRSFCIRSTHYRGSENCPGLVLGLDRGGMCRGRLYRIAAKEAMEAAAYLHDREMVSGCYLPKWLTLYRADGVKQRGLAYVADPHHWQYAGKLPDDEIVAMICKACGTAGRNIDYLRNTVEHLDDIGLRESRLHRILRRIDEACSNA